jgi:hypothetical protein
MMNRIDLNLNKPMKFEAARKKAIEAAGLTEGDPTNISWFDHRHAMHSPAALNGSDNDRIVREFAEKWGGQLEVDVNSDYAFTFIDGSEYEQHDSSPYINIKSADGEWYMCLASQVVNEGAPNQSCCTHLDETTGVGG